jgi:predicted RND superfamily exporter protein
MMLLARWALRRPAWCLVLFGALTIFLVPGLARLELRTDGAAVYPRGEAVVDLTALDRETFRDPEQVILLLSARPGGPAVASPAGLRRLEAVHQAVGLLPAARRSGVRSLASLLDPPTSWVSLADVPRYLDEIPDEPAAFRALLERVRRHPLVSGLFLAADGGAAAVYIPLGQGQDREELVEQLASWVLSQRGGAFDLRLTGPLVAEVELGRTVLRDLAWLTPLMAAAVALLIFVSLRTPAAVAVVLVEVGVLMICTLGAMGRCGVPVTLVTTVLPVLLLAMGVADEVHFLERLQNRLASSGEVPGDREGMRRAVEETLRELQRPILLTSLTTAVGFFSFPSGRIEPLRQFGIFAGAGILLALLLAFTLIPALVLLLPPSAFRPRRLPGLGQVRPGDPFELRLAGRETQALAIGLGLVVLTVPGIFLLAVQDSWVDNFNPGSALVSAERDFNARFWGSYRFDVVLSGGEAGFFRGREGIVLLERLSRRAGEGPHVGGVVSPLVPLRMLGDVVGKPGELSALDPGDLRTLSALSVILRSHLDLPQLVSADARSARLRLFVNSPDYLRGLELRDFLRREVVPLTAGGPLRVHFSGDVPLALGVVGSIVGSQIRSISWTLAGVAALLLAVYRSPRTTAVVVAPVLAAAAAVFGLMGYTGVPLGIASSLFAALSVGVGVDFGLHFWHAYETGRAAGGDHAGAVALALATTGRAIRWNAVVLALGFLVLTASALKPNHTLGLLLATAILAAYAATFLLLPRLVRR